MAATLIVEHVILPWLRAVDEMFKITEGLVQIGKEVRMIAIGLAVYCVAMKVLAHWMRNSITASHQQEVRDLLEYYDEMPEGIEEPKDDLEETHAEVDGRIVVKRRKPRRDNGHWWLWYSIAAREQFPNPSNTPAQRRTIHKWISEQMKDDKVTMKDRTKVLARAVEWTYTPNVADVLAKKDARSRAILERKVDYNRPWWSYWWGNTSDELTD